MTSVQYGCGLSAPANWLSFDASLRLRFERVPVLGRMSRLFPPNVMYGDIVKGLPVQLGSAARLYASHVLEHLSYCDAVAALKNSYSVLRPGGVFRLIVPDLAVRASRYVERVKAHDACAAHDFLDSLMMSERRSRSVGVDVFSALGNSRHRWMWDEASMAEALERSGFIDIRRCAFGDSPDEAFSEVEDIGRFIDGGLQELAMECRRP